MQKSYTLMRAALVLFILSPVIGLSAMDHDNSGDEAYAQPHADKEYHAQEGRIEHSPETQTQLDAQAKWDRLTQENASQADNNLELATKLLARGAVVKQSTIDYLTYWHPHNTSVIALIEDALRTEATITPYLPKPLAKMAFEYLYGNLQYYDDTEAFRAKRCEHPDMLEYSPETQYRLDCQLFDTIYAIQKSPSMTKKQEEKLKHLLAQGANINARNENYNTPLQLCVAGGAHYNAALIKFLLTKGASAYTDHARNQSFQCLALANGVLMEHCDKEIITLLLDQAADTMHQQQYLHYTSHLLQHAFENCATKTIKFLIDRGVTLTIDALQLLQSNHDFANDVASIEEGDILTTQLIRLEEQGLYFFPDRLNLVQNDIESEDDTSTSGPETQQLLQQQQSHETPEEEDFKTHTSCCVLQ